MCHCCSSVNSVVRSQMFDAQTRLVELLSPPLPQISATAISNRLKLKPKPSEYPGGDEMKSHKVVSWTVYINPNRSNALLRGERCLERRLMRIL